MVLLDRMADASPMMLPDELAFVRMQIERTRGRFSRLHDRMYGDIRIHDLKIYDGDEISGDGVQSSRKKEGYASYTSNSPKVYIEMLYNLITTANLHVDCQSAQENEQQRIANETKCNFLRSCFSMADKRLLKFVEPTLLSHSGHYVPMRGWMTGRCLLRVNPRTRQTEVDITPWDPLEVYWERGGNGLKWVAHVNYQRWGDILANHPGIQESMAFQKDPDSYEMVFDYYTEMLNFTFTDNMVLKPPTRHGSNEVPCYVTYTGGRSSVAGASEQNYGDMDLVHTGESAFKMNREVYNSWNELLSAYLHIAKKGEKQTAYYKSVDGQKIFEQDPSAEGAEISMMIQEDAGFIPPPQLSREAHELLVILSGEMQRGSLPHTTYGELQFAASGYAIDLLKRNTSGRLSPFITCIDNALNMIADKLCAQYATGWFPPLPIPGYMDGVAPQLISMADPTIIALKPDIPGDMSSKAATAQMLREGEIPLLDDATIRGKVLEMSDEEGIKNRVYEQQAERLVPTALYRTLMEASSKRGEEPLANEYLMEYMVARWMKEIEMVQALIMALQGKAALAEGGINLDAIMGGGGMGLTAKGGMGLTAKGSFEGIAPNQVPQQTLTGIQQQQAPNIGPFTPPGTPRPGAQGR